MHLEDAIDIIDYKRYNPLLHYSNTLIALDDIHTSSKKDNKTVVVSNTEYFMVNAIELNSAKRIYPSQMGSFIVYVAVEGSMEIVTNDRKVLRLERGRSAMIPASMEDFIIRPAAGNFADISRSSGSILHGKNVVLEIYMPQPQEEEDDYLI